MFPANPRRDTAPAPVYAPMHAPAHVSMNASSTRSRTTAIRRAAVRERVEATVLAIIITIAAAFAMFAAPALALAEGDGNATATVTDMDSERADATVRNINDDGTVGNGNGNADSSGRSKNADDGGANTGAGADTGSNANPNPAAETPAQPAGPVPNIIVTNFTYGGADATSVQAGARFDLTITYQNMGKVAVGNMVVTVDGGDSFVIAGGTNTFYVESLAAGGANTLTVPMQAVSGASSGAQGITVGFRYEYVDQNVRSSNSSEVRVSVPVSQPDRFDVTAPTMPADGLTAGQEATLTLPYVNKGKADVANVEATMEGDGFEPTVATQYVGNVASGATGSIGYAFTPGKAGSLKATLKVSYEDADGNQRTKEFPVEFEVAEAVADDSLATDDDMMVESETGVPAWAWFAVAAVVAGGIALVVVLVRRRKRKARKRDFDDEWAAWEQEDADAAGAEARIATDDSAMGASASGVATSAATAPSRTASAAPMTGAASPDAPTMALGPVNPMGVKDSSPIMRGMNPVSVKDSANGAKAGADGAGRANHAAGGNDVDGRRA